MRAGQNAAVSPGASPPTADLAATPAAGAGGGGVQRSVKSARPAGRPPNGKIWCEQACAYIGGDVAPRAKSARPVATSQPASVNKQAVASLGAPPPAPAGPAAGDWAWSAAAGARDSDPLQSAMSRLASVEEQVVASLSAPPPLPADWASKAAAGGGGGDTLESAMSRLAHMEEQVVASLSAPPPAANWAPTHGKVPPRAPAGPSA